MSMENVKKFYELALKDEELKKELKRINERITVKQSDFVGIRKLVEEEILPLARKRGLDFTADELVSFANEQYTKLSEEDLLEVSGGLSTRNTAIGLSTVLLLSLGATSAINLLSHNDDLNQSISMSAPAETSENESQPNEEEKDNGDSQNEAKSEKSEEANAQNNSGGESTNAQVQQGESAKQTANNNVTSDAKDAEDQDENVADAEEAMAQGEESMFGRLQERFDQGRFDYEEDDEDEASAFGGMKLFADDDEREPYKGQSFVGNMRSRETLVAQLADYLRSIDGDLNNVRESDQDKLKKDVQEAFGWIFEKGDGSGYGVQKMFGIIGRIEKSDYDAITEFANKYGCTGYENETGFVPAVVTEDEAPTSPSAEVAPATGEKERVPDSVRRFIPDPLGHDEGTERSPLHYRRDIQNNAGAQQNAPVAQNDESDMDAEEPSAPPAVAPRAAVKQVPYKAQSSFSSRATMVKNVANYLRSLKDPDIYRGVNSQTWKDKVSEADSVALAKDLDFLANKLKYVGAKGYEIEKAAWGSESVSTKDARIILHYHLSMLNKDNKQPSAKVMKNDVDFKQMVKDVADYARDKGKDGIARLQASDRDVLIDHAFTLKNNMFAKGFSKNSPSNFWNANRCFYARLFEGPSEQPVMEEIPDEDAEILMKIF